LDAKPGRQPQLALAAKLALLAGHDAQLLALDAE